MLKVRVIPCLDVKDGRVVKGVQFLSLRDAGAPPNVPHAQPIPGPVSPKKMPPGPSSP